MGLYHRENQKCALISFIHDCQEALDCGKRYAFWFMQSFWYCTPSATHCGLQTFLTPLRYKIHVRMYKANRCAYLYNSINPYKHGIIYPQCLSPFTTTCKHNAALYMYMYCTCTYLALLTMNLHVCIVCTIYYHCVVSGSESVTYPNYTSKET